MAGYMPPALSALIIEVIPASSRMPLANWASAVERNVEMVIRFEDLTAAPPVLAPVGLEPNGASFLPPFGVDAEADTSFHVPTTEVRF